MTKALPVVIVLVTDGCTSSARLTQAQLLQNHFAACPGNYQAAVQGIMSQTLFDPCSAVYRYISVEKYVCKGQLRHLIIVDVNAKNRFGGYVGEHFYHFMCFPNRSIRGVNQWATGFVIGIKDIED